MLCIPLICVIVYETPQGKAISRDHSSALGPPDIFITIVPILPPSFYATPLGITAIVIISLIVGVAVTVIIFRRKRKMV